MAWAPRRAATLLSSMQGEITAGNVQDVLENPENIIRGASRLSYSKHALKHIYVELWRRVMSGLQPAIPNVKPDINTEPSMRKLLPHTC